jgi:hypothetical protein
VHFQRIETNVGLGVPDVNGCGDGVEFWLELKVSSAKDPQAEMLKTVRVAISHGRGAIFHGSRCRFPISS